MKTIRHLAFAVGLAFALSGARAWAANVGTVTLTTDYGRQSAQDLCSASYAWTSDASGVVTLATSAVHGNVLRCITTPGQASPSANYDITFTDQDGADVLNGSGANRSATATEDFIPGGDAVNTSGPCSLNITNAGNAKQGTFRLLFRR